VNGRPAYRELPLLEEGSDYRHAWQVFPVGDNLGSLATITAEARLGAIRSVCDGTVVNVSLPLSLPDPPMFRREPYRHEVFSTGRNNMDDRLDRFYLQSSTQWDGFRHVRAREFGFFTGYRGDFSEPGAPLGIEHWAQEGIVGRGVLLDFADRLAAAGDGPGAGTIDAGMLRDEADRAGVRPGDVLCIRTGWMARYLAAGADERRELAEVGRWPGLAGSAEVAEVLWDRGVAAVAADNPAVEVAPGSPAVGSLHRRLIPLLGIPLGELFDFERLAEACRARGRADFLLASVPLHLPGGVGSPGNAVAVL
jgi:kynurenine formamidase